MIAFIFGSTVIEGLLVTDPQPTTIEQASCDPEEAYGPTIEWGYGQVHERNSEGLVRVTWPFPEKDVPDWGLPPEWIIPTALTDSRCNCIYQRRCEYVALGGKIWADEQYWEPGGEQNWKWLSKGKPY